MAKSGKRAGGNDKTDRVLRMREQKERQQAAIDTEVGDLADLQTALISKPNRSSDEDQLLGGYTAKIRELNHQRALLGAAYLSNVANLLRIDELIKKLESISITMEEEARKMAAGVNAMKNAAKILTLGTKVVQTLEEFSTKS